LPHRLQELSMRQSVLAALLLAALALGIGYFLGQRTPAPTTASILPASAPQDADAVSGNPIGSPAAPDSEPPHTTRMVAKKAIKPLPAPGAPLTQIFDELKARADAGDAAAASRLFRDLELCKRVDELRRALPDMVSYAEDSNNDKPSSGHFSAEQMLERSQRMLDFVKHNETTCAGLDQNQINAITPAMLEAAQLGDRDARDCYVTTTMFSRIPGLLDHPEWLTQYKQHALPFVESAIQEGDWRVVDMLQHAYAGDLVGTLLGQQVGTDPALAYRYLKLLRLGAIVRAASLDQQLAEAQRRLTPDEIADATSWAQDTYARYFAGSSSDEIGKGLHMCRASDEY
jgi:hypothetical protein